MDWMKIMWIVCGVVWGLVIVFAVGLRIVNRIRNRSFKDDNEG